MKVLIDLDILQNEGVITPELARKLSQHAVRDSGSTAINMLLAFGAVVLVAGIMAMFPLPDFGALFGLLFLGAGWFVQKRYAAQWEKLGSIWLIIGALLLAGSLGILIGQPFLSALVAASILVLIGIAARSQLLVALIPFALISAIGGSTDYWTGCYAIIIQEASLTIGLFTGLGLIGWSAVKRLRDAYKSLALVFTRVCVILVNFGFWIGSLWGDTPGALWMYNEDYIAAHAEEYHTRLPTIPAIYFAIGWAVALLVAGMWAAKNGRRFLVNTVAVFAAIHFYTQWFERLGAEPLSVIIAGAATIAIGLALWKYNKRQIEALPVQSELKQPRPL